MTTASAYLTVSLSRLLYGQDKCQGPRGHKVVRCDDINELSKLLKVQNTHNFKRLKDIDIF